MINSNNRTLYFRLLNYLKPYRKFFFIGVISIIFLALTQPMIAALMKWLIDGAFVERNSFYIQWSPIALVSLFLIRGGCDFTSATAFEWVSSKVVFDIRQEMFDRLVLLPVSFYDANYDGKIIAKFINDVTQVTASSTTVLITLIRDSVQVIGLIAWLFYLDWVLSLIIFAFIPVVVVIVILISKRLRLLSRRLQEKIAELNHTLGEVVRGHKEVKIFNGYEYETRRFSETANWIRRYQFKTKVSSAFLGPVNEVVGAAVIAYVIYISTSRIDSELMTAGEFTSFFIALGLLFSPVKRLTKINEPLQKSLAAAESVFSLIDKNIERDYRTIKEVPFIFKKEIQFKNINFSYNKKSKPIIKELSLNISHNESIALVGESGSGKTTLAMLIARLYDINQGEILIDGVNLKKISLTELRKNISLVSQDITLFSGSIAENINYGSNFSKNNIGQLIEKVAILANADDFIDNMPLGIHSSIGDNGIRLSGGQRQRIAIARALLKNAPILILDEATSALDAKAEGKVQKGIENLMRNRTTIIIAHRLSTIKNADKIVVMEKGRIIEIGTHDQLLGNSTIYANLYNSQFKS